MRVGRVSRYAAVCLTVALMALMQGNACAWEPNAKDLDAAISSGDFAGYLANATAWLSQKMPADAGRISESSMTAMIKDPALASTLAVRQLVSKVGADNLGKFAKTDQDSKTFLGWLLKNTPAMEIYLEASTPTGLKAREEDKWTLPVDSLERWKKIYFADPESKEGMYLRLAIGAAIGPPGSNGRGAGGQEPPGEPLTRYKYFKTAHKNKELFPSFDKLSAWDYSKVVSSHASEADLTWGRKMINTYRPAFRDGEKVVQITSSVWRRNSPVPYTNMATVLQGGGKCGPRSSFAVFINQAFGIPSIGVSQPAHACVAWRDINGVWQVGYGKGWGASRLAGLTGPDFVEGSLARSRATQFSQVEHLRWLASSLASKDQATAVMGVAQKIAQAVPAVKTDLNASLNPEEANADPGVETAAAGKPVAKNDPAAKPAAAARIEPFKPVNGVFHVDAGIFSKTEGEGMFSYQPGVIHQDCYTGGKQVYFAQQMKSCIAEYDIDAAEAGKYEITMKVAAINDGQVLQVGSDAFNAVAYVKIPMSHGLWATTEPVEVKLIKGLQKIQISTVPNQRGVALKAFDLKPKGK